MKGEGGGGGGVESHADNTNVAGAQTNKGRSAFSWQANTWKQCERTIWRYAPLALTKDKAGKNILYKKSILLSVGITVV